MLTKEEARRVHNRLALYTPDVQINSYLNSVSRVSEMCHAILKGELKDEDSLTKEKLDELSNDIQLKYVNLGTFIEGEKLKNAAHETAVAANVERIKAEMDAKLPIIQDLNGELMLRNKRLEALNSDIDEFNLQQEKLVSSSSNLDAYRKDWEEALGKDLLEKLIAAEVFTSRSVVIHEADGHTYNTEKLSVSSNFSASESELRRTNNLMKKDIKRLTVELEDYKTKWLKNAQVFGRISAILQDELISRELGPSGIIEDDENEEEDDEDEDHRYKRQRDQEDQEDEEDYDEEEMDDDHEDEREDEREDEDINVGSDADDEDSIRKEETEAIEKEHEQETSLESNQLKATKENEESSTGLEDQRQTSTSTTTSTPTPTPTPAP